MSYLDTLLGKTGKLIDTAGRATGNVLPDFGLSERAEVRGASSIPTAERVQKVNQDPRFSQAPGGGSPSYPSVYQIPDQGRFIGPTQSGGGGQVAGVYDDASARAAGYTGLNDYRDNTGGMQGNADASKASALGAIQARLGQFRDIVNRNIGRAGDVRSEVVNNIGSTYGLLKNRAQTARDTSLENLGQEDVAVQNQYGEAAGTARSALDSALRRNRMLARATGRLNSSFYDETQADTNEGGARSIAGIAEEEAGKRAGIGTRKTETSNWFEQKATEIGQEEASLKSQAEREYQDQVNAAQDMERSFGIDSMEQAQQAEIAYQSKLDQINNYLMSRAERLAQVANAAGAQEASIQGFSAVNPTLQRILSNTQALNQAQNFTQNVPSVGAITTSLPGNNDLAFYNQQQPKSAFEDLQRRLGNVLTA